MTRSAVDLLMAMTSPPRPRPRTTTCDTPSSPGPGFNGFNGSTAPGDSEPGLVYPLEPPAEGFWRLN